tara:strand:+ start:783 stop:1034 length:252 start_codon:yes stop_codon:yes gene_type:complete
MSPLLGGNNAIVRREADWVKKGRTVTDPNSTTTAEIKREVKIRIISRWKFLKLSFELRLAEIRDKGSLGENNSVRNKTPNTVG